MSDRRPSKASVSTHLPVCKWTCLRLIKLVSSLQWTKWRIKAKRPLYSGQFLSPFFFFFFILLFFPTILQFVTLHSMWALCIFKTFANNASLALLLKTLAENMCSKLSRVLVGDQSPEDLWLFPQQPWNEFMVMFCSVWSMDHILNGFREKFTKSRFFLEEVFTSLSQFRYYYKIEYCKVLTFL